MIEKVSDEVIVGLSNSDKLLLDNISKQLSLLTAEISRLADAVEASMDLEDEE